MKNLRSSLCLIVACTCFSFCSFAQKDSAMQYSSPVAPVGDSSVTVPSSVKPILDYWMRDAFITYAPDGYYYLTGTTATPGRIFPKGNPHCWDYSDGIYLWKSKDMKTWKPAGLVWSFDKDAADWQKRGKPVPAGAVSVNGDPLDSFYRAVWAPEIHYIKSKRKWLMVACLNGGGGSFVLQSTSGKPEGPYTNLSGNDTAPIFPTIDASLFEDDNGDVYVVGHNHFIAKMKPDLSGLAEPFRRFAEKPYNPEPYIEGVYLTKYNGKYQLLQTVWSVPKDDGTYTFVMNDPKTDNKKVHSYDVVVAEADSIYGPYSGRYPAIMSGGHNNIFQDAKGNYWSSTFFNPRGVIGRLYPVTCRPAVVPVKWVNGKLMPDKARADAFYGVR
ncbi:MAG: family 43 glycosylhydrolase [Williamsia sp.]|nr:family 43 glycosylhydrolase [Williamsia sp.]